MIEKSKIMKKGRLCCYSDMDSILFACFQHFVIPPSWMHLHLKDLKKVEAQKMNEEL